MPAPTPAAIVVESRRIESAFEMFSEKLRDLHTMGADDAKKARKELLELAETVTQAVTTAAQHAAETVHENHDQALKALREAIKGSEPQVTVTPNDLTPIAEALREAAGMVPPAPVIQMVDPKEIIAAMDKGFKEIIAAISLLAQRPVIVQPQHSGKKYTVNKLGNGDIEIRSTVQR